MAELLIWRPMREGMCTMTEIKSGICTLVDLLKMNAVLDAENDIKGAVWAQAVKT